MPVIPEGSFGFFGEDDGPRAINAAGDTELAAISWQNSTGAILESGVVAANGTDGILVQTKDLVEITTIPLTLTGNVPRGIGASLDQFHAIAQDDAMTETYEMKRIDGSGNTLETLVNQALTGFTPTASPIAASIDNLKLYYVTADEVTVRDFIWSSQVTSELITVGMGELIYDILTLPNEQILAAIVNGTVVVRRYNTSGVQQQEYAIPGANFTQLLLARNEAVDSTSFWAFVGSTDGDNAIEINVTTGAVIQTIPITA